MSNFLDMRCPKCGDQDSISVLGETWLQLTEDGTKPSEAGDHHYTPDSTATCGCGYWGQLSDFEPVVEKGGAA